MKNIRFICAQPTSLFYAWQVEVLINNFMDMGINPNNIDIVSWKMNDIIPTEWVKLTQKYPVRFFFYDDTRTMKHYISSIRPNILKQHFILHPELENEAIFYHDCDIVFTKPIDWKQFLDDDKWYGSDTRWYIAHSYILSKGQDIIDKMCEIIGIEESIIKDNELNSIGAQYLMKGINAEFWANVERDCEILYKDISELNNTKKAKDNQYHELQIWCADMWAVLWNAWKLDKETICHPDLEFAWGTSSESDYNKLNILHNAGVVSSADGLFYKAEFMNRLPYNLNLNIKEGTASKKYYEIIQQVEKKSVLI
jgi:hypothetical protein